MQIKKAAGRFFPLRGLRLRLENRIKGPKQLRYGLRPPLLSRYPSYLSMAMTSISHRTFLGICFTATQLLAGFPVKYSA